MRPALPKTFMLLLMGASLAGCSWNGFGSSQAPTAQTGAPGKTGPVEQATDVPPDVFTVPEIPIAPNTRILKEDTVIVGSDEAWTGQVVLRGPYKVAQMTEFYRKEMPRFAWSETSLVRARRTAISFIKDQRVVIVRISQVSDGEAEVDIVVSPNSAVGEYLGRANQNIAPSTRQAPVPRAKPQ